jgi:hypothetical protein
MFRFQDLDVVLIQICNNKDPSFKNPRQPLYRFGWPLNVMQIHVGKGIFHGFALDGKSLSISKTKVNSFILEDFFRIWSKIAPE